MAKVIVDLSPEQIATASRRIVKAMNETQQRGGFTIDEVLAVTLYMCGAGLRQRGATFDLDRSVRDVLAAFVRGYEDAEPAQDWQIKAAKSWRAAKQN